jgi:hypothetical protein
MALAETLILQTLPSTMARTFWMFGLNLRLVTPVMFLPTPPRYLALPRLAIELPADVFLPVKWHTLDVLQISVLNGRFGPGIHSLISCAHFIRLLELDKYIDFFGFCKR